jgi:phosphoglycerate dehydrogenase-like enzyme
MKSLLLHKITFDRISSRLSEYADRVSPITMDLAGAFHDTKTGAAIEQPQPDIGFGSNDVWSNPKARKFLAALQETPRLEWFQSSAAGADFPALAALGRKADAYTTCHVQSEAMAEWALWAALDFLRAGPAHRAQQTSKTWARVQSREIASSRWLIIGFGSIGAAIGRRVKALGGHVTGVRRSGGSAPEADTIVASLTPQLLATADIVLLSVPHTRETEGMADAAFFAAMKPDAAFLNLGRGALVKENDLMAALDAGRPAHAALDVTTTEPLPADNPLWSHPKVMITPHDSGFTHGTLTRADDLFLDNLDRFLGGRPLRHLADKSIFRE